MKKSKLSYKLLKYVIPLVIAPLILLGLFTLYFSHQSSDHKAKVLVTNSVIQNSQKLNQYLTSYSNTVSLLSRSPVLDQYLQEKQQSDQKGEDKLGQLLAVFASYSQAYPEILSVELIDLAGKNAAFFSPDLFAQSLSDIVKPLIQLNDKQTKQEASEQYLYLLPQTAEHNAKLFYVQPVTLLDLTAQQRWHWGYLVFSLDPHVLMQTLTDNSAASTINFIFDRHGHVLLSANQEMVGKHFTFNETEQLIKIAASDSPSLLPLSALPEKQYVHFNQLIYQDIYYFSATEHQQLYQAAKRVTITTVILIIFVILLTPTLIFVVVRKLLIEPVDKLAEASQSIGRGDFSVKLATHANDELGNLYQDFNAMVFQLNSYRGRLEDYQQHLEEKVSQRTHDLNKTNVQLRHAIEEAEKANNTKSRFLANMSHEIRTPLTAIIGFTEQVLQTESIKGDDQKSLSTVLRNSKHLLDLINNILDLSKIEAEKLATEFNPVSVFTFIADIESILEASAQNKTLDFNVNYQFPLPEFIQSDFTRLKQILLNVGSNAIKFTTEGHVTITLKMHDEGQQLCFIVEDTGIGMNSDEMSRAFKPFEQADSSTTRVFGGTGLGLCISSKLAELLGGQITIASEIDKGSIFTIYVNINMPADDISWLATKPHIEYPEIACIEHPANDVDVQVLVAEDNKDNQALIYLLLSQRGYQVDIVNNGAEAAEAALIGDYDIVLMDMQMPVMGGLEATKMLRATGYDTPIIALTANVMKEDICHYLTNGCNDAIAKPIEQVVFFSIIEQHLSLNEAHKKALAPLDEIKKTAAYQNLKKAFELKLPHYASELEEAYSAQLWHELSCISHSLKGAAGSFGYEELSHLAAYLESALRQKRKDDIKAGFAVLKQHINQLIE